MGILGDIGSVVGVFKQDKQAKKQYKLQKEQLDLAKKAELDPFKVFGPAGETSYGPGGIQTQLSPQMQQLFGQFGSLAGHGLQSAQYQGLPPGILQALSRVNQFSPTPTDTADPILRSLLGSTAGIYGQSGNQLSQQLSQGFQRPLMNTAFAGAAQKLQEASQGYGGVEADTLANLRSQAQPFEQRQFQDLQQNLFSTGRLGSTGGSLQTEAFARGLGQADLDRQLQARNQALQTQQTNFGIGQGLAGVGTGIAQTGDQLLQSAFSNFGNTTNLMSGLSQQRMQNSTLLNQMGYDRANQGLGNQINLASLPAALQGTQLQLALQALQGQSGLQQMNLNQYNTGLATEQAHSNSLLGAASVGGQITTNPNFGPSDVWSQFLTGAASRLQNVGPSWTDLWGKVTGNQGSGGGGGGTYGPPA